MRRAKVVSFTDIDTNGPFCIVELEGADDSWLGEVVGRHGRIWRIVGKTLTGFQLDSYGEAGGMAVGDEVILFKGLEAPMVLDVHHDPILEPSLVVGQSVFLPISFPSYIECTVSGTNAVEGVVEKEATVTSEYGETYDLAYGGQNWYINSKLNS